MGYLSLKITSKDLDIDKKLAKAADKAALVVAIQVEKDTRPFVPARTLSMGNRTQSTTSGKGMWERSIDETEKAIKAGKPMVIYPGPYAQYLYKGKLMVDPNTGSAWAKKGVTKVLAESQKDLVIHQTVNPQAQSHWFEASKAQNLDKWKRVAAKAVTDDFEK